jgi:EAL domain-containing protein (putative c-di-GMP-specific phosphodiesterase class I)
MLAETRRLQRLINHLDGPPGQVVGDLHGLRISSHFQPIYSLSHARVVGHEALMRAHDGEGRFVPPPQVLAGCRDPGELAWCDSLTRLVHLRNFCSADTQAQWLFLNVHPIVHQQFVQYDGGEYVKRTLAQLGVPGEQLVLEVVESEMTDLQAFEASTRIVREAGCLIAIDDFGAGHSNFDRVWRLQPDVVKIDRSLVARAGLDARARRVVTQMVSLLHECGAMVLMEGVETQAEALVAMEADADMVQGYYFGRPAAQMVQTGSAPQELLGLYAQLGQFRASDRARHREQMAPYGRAIGDAGVLLGAGQAPAHACRAFLDLPDAELCYVLDEEGYQIGAHVWPQGVATLATYEPLRDIRGACWARRPYFQRAVENIGEVQFTRPYRTLHGNHNCVTVSYAYHEQVGGEARLRVICGDMARHESAPGRLRNEL